jgi:hypothetical protein
MKCVKIEKLDRNGNNIPIVESFDVYLAPICEDDTVDVDNIYNRFVDDIITDNVNDGDKLVIEFIEISKEEYDELEKS